MDVSVKKSISVIIPYYNAAESILKTLRSVNGQTLMPDEVIVIDDCSRVSESVTFLENFRDNYKFNLILLRQEVNRGAAAARNMGISMAKGDYLAFLDADDCWTSSKLEFQMKAMTQFDYLYAEYVESESLVTVPEDQPLAVSVSYAHILKKNLSPVTLMAKRTSMLLFDERFRRCDDFKMSMEALAKGYKVGFLPMDVAYGFKKAIGAGGLTGSLWKMSVSYLRACFYLIDEYPRLTFTLIPFIVFEILKFPLRCFKVYVLR